MSAERLARNDSIFREANERIGEAASEFEMTAQVPFVCECADPECREIIRLSLDEYAAIRRDPRLFVNAVGHEETDNAWTEVVARLDGHVIVEKVGRAGAVAAQLADADDPATAPVDEAGE
jgi:hypothetical protein